MRYINKRPYLQEGQRITDDYLESTCRIEYEDGHYCYLNIDYEGTFAESGSRLNMLQLTLKSQDNKCCYCMRDLGPRGQQVTLEHIIPQSAPERRFNSSITKNVPFLTKQTVIRTGDFVGVPDKQVPPRPHTVAFENLVASCDGTFPDKTGSSQCCNLHRGNKPIYPMFFVENIENEIVYMQDGSMHPRIGCTQYNEYKMTIANVGLNCKNLKDIRRLWHLFKDVAYDILIDCIHDRNLRDKTIMQVLFLDEALSEQDADIHAKFMKDEYWNTLLLYRWFHQRLR